MQPTRSPRVCATRRVHSMSVRPHAAVLVLAVTLLVGCNSSGGGDDTDSHAGSTTSGTPVSTTALVDGIEPGTCWGDARLTADEVLVLAGEADTLAVTALEAQPAFTDPVSCDEPHGLEVYDVVTVDEEVTIDVLTWASTIDPDTARHQRVRSAVAAACRRTDPALSAAADASPLDLIPSPAFAPGTSMVWFPFPYAAWQDGRQSFACALRQDEPGTVGFADFRSPKLDPNARICLDADLVTVGCDEPHTREQLLVLTATTAVAAGKLPGRRAVKDLNGEYVALSPEAFALLDAECGAYFAAVATRPAKGLAAVAEIYPPLWGDDQGEFSAVCTVSSPLDVVTDKMMETSESVVS